jgi:uncharacterized protein GlcG (DUF336 family)
MKYHIFIGTTPDDLKNERRELPRIVMELGHIPVMADYLEVKTGNTGSSEPGAKPINPLIQKEIEDCDYFIALTAHKYCAMGTKNSILEAEYNIAVKNNVPVLALVIDEKARWKASKKENDAALIKKHEDFKKKLKRGVYETWANTAELCQKAQSILVQAINLSPRSGWIKANQLVLPSVANELARLSSENEQLRRLVKIEGGDIIIKVKEQMKHILKLLTTNKVTLSFYYANGENWENTRQFRTLRIFKTLAPELALGKTTAELSRFLGTVLNPDLERIVRKDYPTPSNTIKKIMADYKLLKLVKCTNESEEDAGDEIWEISEYGKELYSAYRMRQLEKGLIKKDG